MSEPSGRWRIGRNKRLPINQDVAQALYEALETLVKAKTEFWGGDYSRRKEYGQGTTITEMTEGEAIWDDRRRSIFHFTASNGFSYCVAVREERETPGRLTP